MGTTLSDVLAGLATINREPQRRSLRQVAALIHLSPGRAQRVFTKLVGESPGRYQQRVALDRAASALVSTDTPIADIAFSNGFGSHEGFTRAFRSRFGLSPREYRTKQLTPWASDNVARVERTSPCVGLYHQTQNKDQERTMAEATDQTITVEQLDATPVLYMARRVDRDHIAEALAELLPAVFQYVMEQGLPMVGPPYVRYIDQSAAFVSLDAGIPLAEAPKPPPPELNIEAGQLPGGPAAVTIHKGPYETLGDSHMALDRWMAANGRQAAGAPWEVYLTDPGEVPDTNDWETQILWPLEPVD